MRSAYKLCDGQTPTEGALIVRDPRKVPIPADLWDRSEVTRALSARDLGSVLRSVRKYTGLSQTEVGELLGGVAQPEISNIERGKRRVAVAVAVGRPDRALQLGETLDTSTLPSGLVGRRSQVHLDLAWACAEREDDAFAVLHLLEAERVAPQAIRVNVLARRLLLGLLARERRAVTPGLRPLARRAGVAA